ncbi:cleavage and polyadenylation specific factor 4, 30kDa [Endogone sp. FLAS-F59071]|nr:cleavage and polyadenylation specific factor 4, 30kDa [Endogone sp. FLAS-F59071]|eukprot:RUS22307.1 cleavage and polyadenylation specific factor 4, 30kDa [Endogone sp. FLAS-F59071]
MSSATDSFRPLHPFPSMIATDIFSYTFDFEDYVKNELGLDLNRELKKDDEQICKFFLKGTCNKGNACQFRHNTGRDKAVVCKHWLRGLCKKGDQCEFLHEFNLKKMPECRFYSMCGECSNGDDCMYLHIDPESKMKECPWYARGFCKLGPLCRHKHVRMMICQDYLTGFCPLGPNCTNGHPKYELPQIHDDEANGRYEAEGRQGGQEIFGQGAGQGQRGGGFQGGGVLRRMEDVTCYKCGLKGHYANRCSSGRGGMGI